MITMNQEKIIAKITETVEKYEGNFKVYQLDEDDEFFEETDFFIQHDKHYTQQELNQMKQEIRKELIFSKTIDSSTGPVLIYWDRVSEIETTEENNEKTVEIIETETKEENEEEDDVIVEFKAVKEDDCISGYMYLEDADDEQPLHFYDENGLEIGTHLPYQETELYTAFCEDCMLIQYLVDFAEENKTIERDGYTLILNEGEPTTETIEVTIKNAEAVIEGTVRPHGNGGRVNVPKKYVGKQVKIVILQDD